MTATDCQEILSIVNQLRIRELHGLGWDFVGETDISVIPELALAAKQEQPLW